MNTPPISIHSPIEIKIEVVIRIKKIVHSLLDEGISSADESLIKCLVKFVGMGVQRVWV